MAHVLRSRRTQLATRRYPLPRVPQEARTKDTSDVADLITRTRTATPETVRWQGLRRRAAHAAAWHTWRSVRHQ